MNTLAFRRAGTGVAVLVVLLAFGTIPVRAQPAPPKVTVGIFSRGLVVQSFYRSATWKAQAQAMVEKRNEAASKGDLGMVGQLDQELEFYSKLPLEQMAGKAPLKNIYEALKNAWPAIAKEVGADMIVETPLYQSSSAHVVDATPAITRYLSTAKP